MLEKRLGSVSLLCVILISLCDRSFAEDCSGHGHPDDAGTCICDTPFPTDDQPVGYTGSQCGIPIYKATAKGDDITASCAADSKCNHLDGDHWVCFGITLGDPSANFLAILLNRTTENGDPDLHGYFYDPENPQKRPQFAGSISGFDFQETGAKSFSRMTISELGGKKGGVVICVHAYGSPELDFSLKAALDPCPNTFAHKDGAAMMCHTPKDADEDHKRYSECTAQGECVCKPPYAKPVSEVFEGLGFADCSAPVIIVDSTNTFSANEEIVYSDHWNYYQVEVAEEDFQVVVDVVQTESINRGRIDLFAKEATPPGYKAGQFDLRPGWNSATDDRSLQISIDRSLKQFRPGVWFLGVSGTDGGAQYDITISKYDCPFNCSLNGVCDAASHQCTCNEGYGGESCSMSLRQLNYTEQITAAGAFDYQYWTLPEVTDEMLAGNVELILKASASSSLYSHHLEAKPAVLLAPAAAEDVFPSVTNFTHRLVLDVDGQERILSLCPSQLEKGVWKLAIYNPMPTYTLNYTLSVSKVARCLNDCSQHGQCSEIGVCACEEGWLGGDCSVEKPSGPSPPPPHRGSRLHAFWMFVMSVLLGSAITFAYIHFRGVPRWLPTRNISYFERLNLYQELSGTEGI